MEPMNPQIEVGDIVRHTTAPNTRKLRVVGIAYGYWAACVLVDGTNSPGKNRVPEVQPPYFQAQAPGTVFDVAYPIQDVVLVKKKETVSV